MVLSPLTILNGVSAIIVSGLGFSIGIYFFLKYSRTKKPLLPVAGILFFCFFTLFLGLSISFIKLVAVGENITYIEMGLIAYSAAPIEIMCTMYLGFELFKPNWKKSMLILYALSAIVFYIALWGFPSDMLGYNLPDPSDLLDISLRSVIMYMMIAYILSALIIIGWGFFTLRRRLEGGVEKTKVTYLGYGFVLFAIAAIIETIIPSQWVIIARVLMITAILLIYEGFKVSK